VTGFPNISVHNKDGTVSGISVTQDPELSHGLSAHGLPALAVAQVDSTGPVIQGQGGGVLLTLKSAGASEQFKVDQSGNVTAAGTLTAKGGVPNGVASSDPAAFGQIAAAVAALLAANNVWTGTQTFQNSVTHAPNVPLTVNGNIDVTGPGYGLEIPEGTNAKQGTATLNGTTDVVISTTTVTANSRIFLTIQVPGGTVGSPYVSARSAGVSFSVKSTNASDTSTVAYFITEPG
jgi:hypothetical protein